MNHSHHAKRSLLCVAIASLSMLPLCAAAQVIQAEDYIEASDNDPANNGGAYRNDYGVDIQRTADTGGGYNVGWVETNERLIYNVNVPAAGEYTIALRTSSYWGASIALELNDGQSVLGIVNVPKTGDWQKWQTITKTYTLPAGKHRLGILAYTGGWNLNWIEIKPVATTGNWWKPSVNTSWHWQLMGTLKTNVNATVYDIDLFDIPATTIASLKAQGRKVVCYFSAGSSEDWRDDYPRFTAADKGNAMGDWEGEHWLDVRSANVRAIMATRLDLAKTKGCDGVEPDNVDGYDGNNTGFPLTAADQISYNRYLADEAHKRGLAIGLKNDVNQLKELEPYFDFAVNEQCSEYKNAKGGSECDNYSVFTSKNKPVFNAEYKAEYRNNTNGARDKLCAASRAANLRTLVLPLDLDGSFRYSCD